MFLLEVTPKTFIVKGGFTNTIAHIVDGKIVIIDPGINYEFFRRIRQKVVIGNNNIEEEDIRVFQKHAKDLTECIKTIGYEISEIFISHSHIDHFGVARILKDNVYLPTVKNFTVAEVYGEEYLREFIIGKCEIRDLQEVNFETINIVPLPGHEMHLVGFLLEKNVLFVSDALPSQLEWVQVIPFLKSAKRTVKTLKKIENLDFEYLILSHSNKKPVLNKVESKELIRYNTYRIESVCEFISKNYLNPDDIIFDFAEKFGINIKKPLTQHLLKTALPGYYDLADEYLRIENTNINPIN